MDHLCHRPIQNHLLHIRPSSNEHLHSYSERSLVSDLLVGCIGSLCRPIVPDLECSSTATVDSSTQYVKKERSNWTGEHEMHALMDGNDMNSLLGWHRMVPRDADKPAWLAIVQNVAIL